MKSLSLFLVLVLVKCALPEKSEKSFQKIDVVYKFPSFVTPDSVIVYTDSSSIVQYGKYKVYILPMGEALVEYGKLIFDTIKYVYIGFDTTQITGFQANSLMDSLFKKVPIDSMLAIRPKISFLERILDSSVDKGKEILKKEAMIKQNFILKMQAFDSMHLYFKNDLKKLNFFSLSKKTDSLYKSKLVEIRLFLSGEGLFYPAKLSKEQRVAIIRFFKNENIDEVKLKAFVQRLDDAYKKIQ